MAKSAIRPGDRVTLHYRLACAGHEVVNTFPEEPETFILGGGDIDPRLEALLVGLPPGAHHSFDLEPGAAFGVLDPTLVHLLPMADFPTGMAMEPGFRVEFSLPNGQTMFGTVLELAAENVKVNFNHPFAGLPVEFEVRILAIE